MKREVILIGGSPMIGKSTLAAQIASDKRIPCISTDDIGEVIQTVLCLDPMRGAFYLDYYAETPKDALIEDIQQYHLQMQPAIRKLVNNHATWGSPLVMEGWALYPDDWADGDNAKVKALWLVAEDGVLEHRLRQNLDFYKEAKNPQKVIDNYLFRSEWHNRLIREQCRKNRAAYVTVARETGREELYAAVAERLSAL